MSLTEERIEELAQRLMEAEAKRAPISPLTDTVEGITVDDAYRVQLAVLEHQLAAGRKVVAKKVGLTSKAMQQMFGVSEPDYGCVLDNMLIQDGAECPMGQLLQPRIEPEVAFMLKADLKGPHRRRPRLRWGQDEPGGHVRWPKVPWAGGRPWP